MAKSTKEVLDDAFYDEKGELFPAEDAIMCKLIDAEGRALWIPGFIFWLFEEYDVKEKIKK